MAATDWRELSHYEPLPHGREYQRDNTTGDRGWLVRRDSKTWVRLDRAGQEILRPFREATWTAEIDHRPLTKFQLAHVTFEADKALCKALGLADLGRRDWLSMTDEKRIAWMTNGPGVDPKRRALYDSIVETLGKMTE